MWFQVIVAKVNIHCTSPYLYVKCLTEAQITCSQNSRSHWQVHKHLSKGLHDVLFLSEKTTALSSLSVFLCGCVCISHSCITALLKVPPSDPINFIGTQKRPLGWTVLEQAIRNRMGTCSPVCKPLTLGRNNINQ